MGEGEVADSIYGPGNSRKKKRDDKGSAHEWGTHQAISLLHRPYARRLRFRLPMSAVSPAASIEAVSRPRVHLSAAGVGRIILWGSLSAVLVVWALAMLSFPFGRDQGILAWAGDTVLRGGMPYRNAWEVKGPTAILPFTLVEFLTGRNMWGIRLFDLLLIGVATASAVYVARRWYGRTASVYAGFLLLFVVSSLDFWTSTQPDGWSAYGITAVIAALASQWRWRYLAAAACIGACTLQKPLYGVFLLLFVPALAADLRTYRRVPWKPIAAVCAGFCGFIGLVIAWFAWRGALGPLFRTYIGFNLAVHTQVDLLTPGQQFRALVDCMRGQLPFSVGMPLAVAGGILVTRRSRVNGATYWLWLGLSFLVVMLQRKYLYYQWLPAMCAVAFGTAVAIAALTRMSWRISARRNWSLNAGVAVFLWLAFVFLPTPALHGLKWLLLAVGHTPALKYYNNDFAFSSDNYFSYPSLRDLSAYVKSTSKPADTLQVWGWDPMINYLSARASPTRFGYDYPLLAAGRFREEYRQEFMRDLQARRPLYVAIAEKDNNQMVPMSSADAVQQFPQFRDFLHSEYRLDRKFGFWELWRRVG